MKRVAKSPAIWAVWRYADFTSGSDGRVCALVCPVSCFFSVIPLQPQLTKKMLLVKRPQPVVFLLPVLPNFLCLSSPDYSLVTSEVDDSCEEFTRRILGISEIQVIMSPISTQVLSKCTLLPKDKRHSLSR